MATWTLSCTVSEIRRLKCRKSTIFPTPFLFRLKFGGVSFGVDPSCWGLQRAKSREIIFQEFKSIWPRYLNVTYGQTDRRTTCLFMHTWRQKEAIWNTIFSINYFWATAGPTKRRGPGKTPPSPPPLSTGLVGPLESPENFRAPI